MNDNNKDNDTQAVKERLESRQNCQKQYTLKKISKKISKQIDEDTDSKVPPEDVRSEIVEIISNDNEAAEVGQLLYSPSCESSGICEKFRELGSGICEKFRELGSGICETLREQNSKTDYSFISYTTVLIGFFLLGLLLTSAPLLEPLPLGLTPLLTLLTGVVLILAGGGGAGRALLNTGWTVIVALLVLLVSLAWVWAPQQTSESLESVVASPQISESLASSLLLSSGAFYATIGVYLFSIANTCYSIGADKGNKELYDTGTEISRAGCLVSGGGAVSLTVGIFITIFNFSLPHYSWLKTGVLFGSVLVSQALILRGLWKHKKQHKWFQDLREDEFSEEHSGE